jgi:DNA mismatch endonuclease (patch repair protein)
MSRIGSADTTPELRVRRLLHGLGYRFRLHGKGLPGRPDIVLARRRAVIFVHGCYWHGHGCARGRPAQSNVAYWSPKIERNKRRDSAAMAALTAQGWRALVVWECATKDAAELRSRLTAFLGPRRWLGDPVADPHISREVRPYAVKKPAD